jgi:hypothetical protein
MPKVQLLNDDGSASMATALMMSHHAFRRDIARFAIALAAGDRSRAGALSGEWQNYRNALHGHHEVEDHNIFPELRQQPSIAPIIDQLSADHRRIDPLLVEGDRAFADLIANLQSATSVVTQISALLDTHLATEEEHMIPFLRGAKAFPPHGSEAELAMFAEGFAWASDGVAPDVLEKVYAMLPAALAARIPAARVAFAERRARVWGPVTEGASRTPVPDWLSGA